MIYLFASSFTLMVVGVYLIFTLPYTRTWNEVTPKHWFAMLLCLQFWLVPAVVLMVIKFG